MNTTYKIIASDGKEYGPVSLEELQAWVLDGRVGPATNIWSSKLDQWKEANSFQELQFELGRAPQIYSVSKPEVEEISERFVGFFSRLSAYFLDHILLGVVSMFIFTVPADFNTSMMGDFQNPLVRKLFIQQGSLELFYYWIMTAAYGATLGKFAIGARIVQSDGSKLGFKMATFRILAVILSVFPTFLFGYLLIIFRRDKRALHDVLLGTKVIYKAS
ncbi:MAG: transporter [Verrucomicrobiales bacterium]|nr:transporter [Verrucomicrobiales bacterium]